MSKDEVKITTRKTPEAKVIELENMQWYVPQCCREGWDDCKHVVNRNVKDKKKNIGL